jgi:1,4-alpha-glucan branching enzyme
MHVLFLSTMLSHQIGGLGTYTENVVAKLSKKHKITLVVPPQSVPKNLGRSVDVITVPYLIRNPLPIAKLFSPQYKHIPFFVDDGQDMAMYFGWGLQAFRLLKENSILKDVDLVHSNDWMNYPLAYLCKTEGIPWMHSSHMAVACLYHKLNAYERKHPTILFRLELEKRSLLDSDLNSSVSESMCNLLRNFYNLPSNRCIKSIYNGVNLKEWDINKVELYPTEKLGFDENDFIIIYVGTGATKGLDTMVSVINRIINTDCERRYKLILVTKSIETCFNRKSIEKIAKRSHGTVLRSFVPQEDLKSLLKTANIALFPYVNEPFGLIALESLAMGTPALVGTGGVREIVEHGKQGYHIDVSKPIKSISSYLDYFRNHKEKLEKMKRSCLERAKLFDWQKTTDRISECYEEILERRSVTV